MQPKICHFGDPEAYIHQSATADHYLNKSYGDSHIPNIVTTILASYRGFDTLGETTVVLTAAVAVMMLLGRKEEEKEIGQDPDVIIEGVQHVDTVYTSVRAVCSVPW